jgi:hypothetical protein
LFLTTRVYINCPPAGTELADAVFSICTSAFGPNGALAVALLLLGLESGVALVTVAVFTIPTFSELARWPVTVKLWEAPDASVESVHVTVPAAKPQPGLADTNDNPAEKGSETTTFVAETGPALCTVRVNVSSVPGTAGLGEATLVIERSSVSAVLVTVQVILSPAAGATRTEVLDPDGSTVELVVVAFVQDHDSE